MVALQVVFPEQLVVHPAVHCILEFMVSFFSCVSDNKQSFL